MNKKLPAVLAALLLSAAALNAQKGFSLRLAGGYAWPGFLKTESIMGPRVDPKNPYTDALVPMANIDHPNDSVNSYQLVRGSYGQGMNFTLGLGYQINRYFGVELGVSYLKSATIGCKQNYELIYDAGGGFFAHSPYTMSVDMKTNAFGLQVSPAIYVQAAKPGWKVYPYARVGVSLPVYGGLTHTIDIHIQDEVFTDAPAIATILGKSPYFLGNNTKVTLKTEGTVSLGVNGALGVKYEPLPFMGVFAEVNGQYLVTRAKRSDITQWDVDGVSKLDARGPYRTMFNYVDELTPSSNNGDNNKDVNGNPKFDPNKAKDDIRPTGPFNNLGINIGVSFVFGKETLKKKEKKPAGQ